MRRDLPWIAWLATGIALERWSPLSRHVRRWLHVSPQSTGHRLFGMAFLAVVAWFTAHVLDEHRETA